MIQLFSLGIILVIIKAFIEINEYKNYKIPTTSNLMEYFFDTRY